MASLSLVSVGEAEFPSASEGLMLPEQFFCVDEAGTTSEDHEDHLPQIELDSFDADHLDEPRMRPLYMSRFRRMPSLTTMQKCRGWKTCTDATVSAQDANVANPVAKAQATLELVLARPEAMNQAHAQPVTHAGSALAAVWGLRRSPADCIPAGLQEFASDAGTSPTLLGEVDNLSISVRRVPNIPNCPKPQRPASKTRLVHYKRRSAAILHQHQISSTEKATLAQIATSDCIKK